MAGKTVISQNGLEFTREDFTTGNPGDWSDENVFGEWRVKQEPVVVEQVSVVFEGIFGPVDLSRWLEPLFRIHGGKEVRVTVEVIDEP